MINGLIAIWSGAIADIPAGWQICDGTNGTPDLRDRFVVGAGAQFDPGDTGGATTHVHDFVGNGHDHVIPAGSNIAAGANFDDKTESDPAGGTTDTASSMPAYFALAFIMKL